MRKQQVTERDRLTAELVRIHDMAEQAPDKTAGGDFLGRYVTFITPLEGTQTAIVDGVVIEHNPIIDRVIDHIQGNPLTPRNFID